MTDITELALRLKLEAHRAVSNFNPQMNIKTRDLKELVDALEKAQETIAFQQGEIKALLSSLESRTVKLPDLRQIVSGDRYVWSDGVYNYSQDVKVALAAAGIKVEAEMKIRIVLQELKEDGVLTTYSNGHIEMLPYRIDENGEEYVEMFPNDIEQH